MADEVRLIRWCDPCPALTDGHRDEATVRYVIAATVDGRGGQPRVLDCCETHAGAVRTVLDLLRVHGRPLRPPAAADADAAAAGGPRPCPLCGWASSRRGGLVSHLKNAHRLASPKQPRKCPDCGAGHEPRAMLQHRRVVHGYDLADDLVARHTKGKGK